LFWRRVVGDVASIFADGPMKTLVCFTTPVDFREMKLFQNFSDRRGAARSCRA
jgi:hypothetical protein